MLLHLYLFTCLCVCAYMHAHYVHACHGAMWRSKGRQSEEQVLSPTMWAPGIYGYCQSWPQGPLFTEPSPWRVDSSLRAQTGRRPRVQRFAPEVRRHAVVEELGRAQMFTSWHLESKGERDETCPSEACCPMATS